MSAAKSTMEMSQEQAQWLFKEGAVLAILDMPEGSQFGIDCNSWETGPRFKGVKMIPPGLHFIYYSAVGRDHQVAPRTGFMYNFRQREVVAKVWDRATEDVLDATGDVREKLEENKQDLDRFLGVYPYDSYRKWISLTDFMTASIVDELLPLCGKINAASPLQSEPSTSESRRLAAVAMEIAGCPADTDEEDPRLPRMKPVPGSQIRFSQLPGKESRIGASPAETTRCNMDKTACLDAIFTRYDSVCADSGAAVLCELQLAFVCFLVGQVFEAFEAWKQLVRLLSSCVDAVSQRPELYLKLLAVLHRQINEIPEDFFVDVVSRDNFLTGTLSSLFDNIEAAGPRADSVKQRAERFRKHLEQKFNWDFGAETGEYAPVVVE